MTPRLFIVAAAVALRVLSAVGGESSPAAVPRPDPGSAKANAPVRPRVIYVTDFYLDPADVTGERLRSREGLGGGRRRAARGEDPADKARKLIDVLSESIVKTLDQAGLKAEYRPYQSGLRGEFIPADAALPGEGWLVAGWFNRVDQGNRAKQAVVGFGVGQVNVEIEVVVSDLARGANQPFLRMGSESAVKKAPGGLVMGLNPYAMAAKFVLSKGATEKDVKKQGVQIATYLVRYLNSGGQTVVAPSK